MHLPDGFINSGMAAGLMVAAAGAVAAAWSRARSALAKRVPALTPAWAGNNGQTVSRPRTRLNDRAYRLASVTALVFAAQMVNFPVASGTSGHLIGAALLAVTFGPAAAIVGLTAVVAIQALVFGDGGLVVLGANVINMAVVAPVVAYLVYRWARQRRGWPTWLSVSLAAWLSVVAAAALAGLELAISGTAAFGRVMPAMLSVHVAIGLAEAAITLLFIRIFRLVPYEPPTTQQKS
jgi:cobalt/nickel transport system permease protein